MVHEQLYYNSRTLCSCWLVVSRNTDSNEGERAAPGYLIKLQRFRVKGSRVKGFPHRHLLAVFLSLLTYSNA